MAKNYDDELAKLVGQQTINTLRLLINQEAMAEQLSTAQEQLAASQLALQQMKEKYETPPAPEAEDSVPDPKSADMPVAKGAA